MIGACQKRLPRLSTGAFHQLFPKTNRFPQDGQGLGGSSAMEEHTAQHLSRHRQLKRGIELRGLAEAFDERLELVHRPLRIALGEERLGVLPFVGGGFCREALLGHRVPKPLHPGIALAEAAGPFQIVAKRSPRAAAVWNCRSATAQWTAVR